MCKAFSGICVKDQTVRWKLGVDSHTAILEMFGISDNTADANKMEFFKFEITPDNGDYRNPNKWTFRVDQKIKPVWFSWDHQAACWNAHEKWKEQLYSIFDTKKKIIRPFKDVRCKRVLKKHIKLLKKWSSVWYPIGNSVGNSIGDSIGDSVWHFVRDSVWNSVESSVGNSVRSSIGDSVWHFVLDSVWNSAWDSIGNSVRSSIGNSARSFVYAQIGSLFNLQRGAWMHTDSIKTNEYPFQPAVDLWNDGLVPSFDGEIWRLHGGSMGAVMFEISQKDLEKGGTNENQA